MKQILWTLFSLFFSQGIIWSQTTTEDNLPISNLYSGKGTIAISHVSEEIENGFTNTQLRLLLPFIASPKQTFVLDASMRNFSLLSDNKIESNLGISWQMHLNNSFTIFSGTEIQYSNFQINKMLKTNNYSDPLAQPISFSQLGVGASIGILQKYFWLIGEYNRNFQLTDSRQNNGYLNENLFLTSGFRFNIKNWEFRIPIQLNNTLKFTLEELYYGSYIAYKDNYLLFKTNNLWDLNFEISLVPYHWLRVSAIYQINIQSSFTTFGTSGSYNWQPKKLDL